MERITSTELGFILVAIDGAIHRHERDENELPPGFERSFSHLRKEQL